jgi:hypothetical protein
MRRADICGLFSSDRRRLLEDRWNKRYVLSVWQAEVRPLQEHADWVRTVVRAIRCGERCLRIRIHSNDLRHEPGLYCGSLPERLYAGGAASRVSINGAGPRDLQTGFPVGRTAFVNTREFRMPAPTLPLTGNNLNFVLFHDMRNVFQLASQVFRAFCVSTNRTVRLAAMSGSIGTCDFNYFPMTWG